MLRTDATYAKTKTKKVELFENICELYKSATSFNRFMRGLNYLPIANFDILFYDFITISFFEQMS